MASDAELGILLKARDEASAALDKVSDRTERMSKQFKLAGVAMMGAGVAIAGALGMALKASADQEAGILRLSVAMKNVGLDYEQSEASLEGWIDAMQQATSFSDTDMRDSLASLIRITRDTAEAQDLLALAMDVAVGTGRDLAGASTLLMYALSGNWGMLERFIPAIKEAKDEEEKWFMLRELFAGQAEAYGESMAGQYDLLKNNLGDIAETIGVVLLPNVKQLADALNKMAQAVKGLPEPLVKGGVAVAAIGSAFLIAGGSVLLMIGYLPKLRTALHTATVAMTAFKASTVGAFGVFGLFAVSVGAAVYGVNKLIDALGSADGATAQLTEHAEQVILAAAAEQGFSGTVEESADFLRELTIATEEAVEADKELADAEWAAARARTEQNTALRQARLEMEEAAIAAYEKSLSDRASAIMMTDAADVAYQYASSILATGEAADIASAQMGEYIKAMAVSLATEKATETALENYIKAVIDFGSESDEATQGLQDYVDSVALAAEMVQNLTLALQGLEPWIGVTGGAGMAPAGGGAPSWVGGYASGGVVPGPPGAPRLAVVHGQETITPPGGGDTGAQVVINVYPVQGQDEREIARQIYLLEMDERAALGEVQ